MPKRLIRRRKRNSHGPPARIADRLVKEMRLAGINNMDEANAWLPGYIEQYNRRFAVEPKDASDAHLDDEGTPETLLRTLSVQVTKTLSKNGYPDFPVGLEL